MKVLSWNVNARTRLMRRQLDAVRSRHPDVVTLQEITAATRAGWHSGLAESGLGWGLDSLGVTAGAVDVRGPRRYGLLVAARFPLAGLAMQARLPWPERFFGVHVQAPMGRVDVFTAHVPPGSSNGWIKVETFEGITNRWLVRPVFHASSPVTSTRRRLRRRTAK